MNGNEAARLIKQDQELRHQPKIIMAMAYGRGEVMAEAEEVGLRFGNLVFICYQ